MLSKGAQALSNAEILAVLLRTGTASETAVQLGQRLLLYGIERGDANSNGLRFLATSSVSDLLAIKGLGPAKVAQLKAAIELGRRISAVCASRAVVGCPADVGALMMEEMRFLDQEQFRVVFLNTKNHVLGVTTVSVGGLNSSPAHPREIFKEAIRRSAAAIVLVHNHPSGDPTPSRDDIEVTRRLVSSGKLLGIEVLDHLIIGEGRYVSFRESNIS